MLFGGANLLPDTYTHCVHTCTHGFCVDNFTLASLR